MISLKHLDDRFSRLVRKRAYWTCEKCGAFFRPEDRYLLEASHFHGRNKKSVRWDLENVDALCRECHAYFHHQENKREYEIWKLERLGREKFMALGERARTLVRCNQAHREEVNAWLSEELRRVA